MTAPLLLAVALVSLMAQSREATPKEGVLFGLWLKPFSAIEDRAAARRWNEVQARAARVKSKLRPLPDTRGAMEMVKGKREVYEALFFAVGTSISPSAHHDDDVWIHEEVVGFVEGLRPCYEWEGGSDCPQKEAEFAEYWLKWNDTGALRDFLPVFASHRWTCAAEALEFEKKPAQAASAHARAKALLTRGLRSKDPLMRYVARELEKDRRCIWPR
jgi:hypothetical protein